MTQEQRSLPSIPTDLAKTELVVVGWNQHFFGEDYVTPFRVDNPHGPDIVVDFTSDRGRLDEADAVWFHGPTIDSLPEKRDGQSWVLMSMESDVNYPALRIPPLMAQFDLKMTYRLDADIPCPYPNWPEYGTFLESAPLWEGMSEGALASYIASNPVEYRDSYAEELMRHVAVDSLGSCLNNRKIEDFVTGPDVWARGGWGSILQILPRYKFYLAFENSRATDYVTERVFHALVCGTVPVYLGAPNVRDFMPDDDALILASEFESPAELADHLKRLDADPEAYARHLRWKRDGYSGVLPASRGPGEHRAAPPDGGQAGPRLRCEL